MKFIFFRPKTKPFESAVLQYISCCETSWNILHNTNNVSKLTWVNISDTLLYSCVQWGVEMCSSACSEKLIYTPWNLMMQSMVLQIMSSKYHAHLKYFEITDGGCVW